MYTLPKIAEAADFEYNTAKRWAQRHAEWFANFSDRDPGHVDPESRFGTRRFTAHSAKAILIAMTVTKCGVPSNLAFEVGLSFVFSGKGVVKETNFTSLSARKPGKLFPENDTYALMAPGSIHQYTFVSATPRDLGEKILDFCGASGNDADGCTVIDLTRVLHRGLSRLGLESDEISAELGD